MPLTIGPFTNVPAPGDPIRSPWAQQVTRYVVNRPYVQLSSAAQTTVPPSVNTTLPLTPSTVTADPYAMVTAGGLLVPTGYGGLWAVAASFAVNTVAGGKPVAMWISLGATRFAQDQVLPSSIDGIGASAAAIVLAAAGATIGFGAFNLNTAAITVNVLYLTAAYLGGTGGAPQ